MAFIIKALVGALSHGEKCVLLSDPTTIALVEGGTHKELEVALYHLFMYRQPMVKANSFLHSEDFLNWVNKEFALDASLKRCGRPSLSELTGTYVRPIITFSK